MESAKIFKNGRSQAVRLPKEYRFDGDEVYIKKVGDMVALMPKNKVWEIFLESLEGFSEDFMNERPEDLPQSREI